MPGTKAKKSTPTKARVTFPDNSPSNATPASNTLSNTKTTPSTSAIDTAEDHRLTDTNNKTFSQKRGDFDRKGRHLERGARSRHSQR